MNTYLVQLRVAEDMTEARTIEADTYSVDGVWAHFYLRSGGGTTAQVASVHNPYLVKRIVEET